MYIHRRFPKNFGSWDYKEYFRVKFPFSPIMVRQVVTEMLSPLVVLSLVELYMFNCLRYTCFGWIQCGGISHYY